MSQYAWKYGETFYGIRPEDAARELDRISGAHGGRLDPPDIVEAARPAGSVLHDAFEWDDSTAAKEYRLSQARRLVKMIVIRHVEMPRPVPMFLSVPRADEGLSPRTYRHIDVLVRSPDELAAAMKDLQTKVDQICHVMEGVLELARAVSSPKVKTLEGIERRLRQVKRAAVKL